MNKIIVRFIILSLFLINIGCQESSSNKNSISLAYVEWDSEVASTNVVKVVLEQAGYEVKLYALSAAAMWQAVGSGSADAMVSAWLPSTHKNYYDKVKNKVEDLGANLVGTRIGLVVPQYVTIDSIDALSDMPNPFNNEIIGIDPGAGIMLRTDQAIQDYALTFKLIYGSSATMVAALNDAILRKEWMVITGWQPHWMFTRFKLKFLQDPKDVYGEQGQIDTIVRKGLKQDKPKAYNILKQFFWDVSDMQEVMAMNAQNNKPYENAKIWVDKHPELVAKWLHDSYDS